jgi:NAD(P)-dependent dehydrogenase (short-subunit alcohol dehydrogenase family)
MLTCTALRFCWTSLATSSRVVIASQSGHRLPALPAEQNAALATTPVEELLGLPMLASGRVKDTLHAYQLAKRGNSLRVMAEAVRWGKRGALLNTISPGIIMTPLAKDELTGPRGAGYRRMIELSAAGRAGTPDEVANVAALLMGRDGEFITGSDFLMDGGVTAAYWFGDLAPPSKWATGGLNGPVPNTHLIFCWLPPFNLADST